MEFIQDYIPQLYNLYTTYYAPYSPYLTPIYRSILHAQSYFYRYLFPTLYPIYTLSNTALRTLSSSSPDIFTLLILAVALVVSLRILDYMRRTSIYWISLGIRLVMWIAVLGLGWYVSERGVEQSLEDFGWVWGLLAGLEEEGQRVGSARARGSERNARRMGGAGKRGRTRGAWW